MKRQIGLSAFAISAVLLGACAPDKLEPGWIAGDKGVVLADIAACVDCNIVGFAPGSQERVTLFVADAFAGPKRLRAFAASTSTEDVASVDVDGDTLLFTGNAAGDAVIAIDDDHGNLDTLHVPVEEPTRIDLALQTKPNAALAETGVAVGGEV